MCPGADGGGFIRSEETWELFGTRESREFTANRTANHLDFEKKHVTSQITLKLEGISVEDMTDGDSMLMK